MVSETFPEGYLCLATVPRNVYHNSVASYITLQLNVSAFPKAARAQNRDP